MSIPPTRHQENTAGLQPQVDRTGKWIGMLMVFVVLLYAAGLNNYWRVQRDSALYLGLGQSLAEGRGYTFNQEPHKLVLPGLPLMIAAVMRVFGADCIPNDMLPLNIMLAMMGSLTGPYGEEYYSGSAGPLRVGL